MTQSREHVVVRRDSSTKTFLVVGAPDVVARVLEQVFALFAFELKTLPFDGDTTSATICHFGEHDFDVPVLAGSIKAWEVLRSVNRMRLSGHV